MLTKLQSEEEKQARITFQAQPLNNLMLLLLFFFALIKWNWIIFPGTPAILTVHNGTTAPWLKNSALSDLTNLLCATFWLKSVVRVLRPFKTSSCVLLINQPLCISVLTCFCWFYCEAVWHFVEVSTPTFVLLVCFSGCLVCSFHRHSFLLY